ncbi:MAG: hypothetical protein WA987_05090 [Cellvibrio sp.]|jgi:hypothetical protein
MPHSLPTGTAAAFAPATTNSAIDLSQLQISVSQLLGYDYVFIGGPGVPASFNDLSGTRTALLQLIDLLKVVPEQSVFVILDGSADAPRFTRYEAVWNRDDLVSVQPTLIENPEQQEFINMIWQCSSPLTF